MSIECRNLSHRYGAITALRDVSVNAEAGRITALLGPNASGKSTLLRLIIGALTPTEGEVLIDGKPAHRLRAAEVARRVAYVPQRSTVSAAFTVREVVSLGRFALSASPRRVDDALERMELADLADRPFPALSVGQQQRVTLARALAQLEPGGHLILDEPTSAMDLHHAHHVMAMLRELAAQGTTIVLAMHDLARAARTAHKAWLLNEGAMVASGPVCDVLTVDRLRDVFRVDFQWIDLGVGGREPILWTDA